MKKRLLSILLSVALWASLATAVSAEEACVATSAPAPWAEELVLVEEPGVAEEPAQVLADARPDYLGAAEALRRGIAKGAKTIYIDDYHIPAAELSKVTKYISYRYGELFAWTGGRYTTTGENGTGYVRRYEPLYDATLPQDARERYNKELDAIVAQVPADATDAEKVLFIHDYLAAHYEYDHSFKNYDAYSFLRDGKGVCQAYMLVFSALMDKLGIPVSYVESTILNHAWNVVQLDGKWYHVDVTWDDPGMVHTDAEGKERIVDVQGAALHDYFLISDEADDTLRAAQAEKSQIQNYKKDFVYGENFLHGEGTMVFADESYAGPHANADSPMVYVAGDDSWYYISTDKASEGGGLYRWTQAEGSVLLGTYSRYIGNPVPLVEYQGSLFFADPEKICRYELDKGAGTRKVETVFDNPDPENSPFNGIKVADGVLSYKLRTTGELVAHNEEILPYHDTEGGAFSYYYNFGAVGLKPGNKGRVLIAWYDPDSGMMKRLAAADAEGTYGVPIEDKDLICAIFVLKDDGTLAPVRDKFTVHGVSVAPAQ